MIYARPRDVIRIPFEGTANMATAGSLSTVPRVAWPNGLWCLAFVRVHFSSGTGAADCTLSRDTRGEQGSSHNADLFVFRDRGTGVDINFIVLPEEYAAWTFDRDEELILRWTNPNSGTMRWAALIGIVPEDKIVAA